MPQFKVKTGYRLTVADPDQPGQVLDKIGGDAVDLDDETAQQYADALEPIQHQAPAAEHAEG